MACEDGYALLRLQEEGVQVCPTGDHYIDFPHSGLIRAAAEERPGLSLG